MRRILLVPALLLAACGGGGSNTDPNLLAAAQCTALGLEDLNEIFGEVSDFLASLDAPPSNVTYNAATGDFSITASFGTIDGNVDSTDDISNGIDAGESASATWSINPVGGATITGSGVFALARTAASVFDITGNGSITDGACVLNATNTDLNLDLTSGLGPVGSFDFNATSAGGSILGTMNFDGSDTATVNAMFQGVSVTFTIDLNTFIPDL